MKTVLTIIFLILIKYTSAQDFLHLKDSTILKVKVKEIGADKISFKKYNNLRGPDYIIQKSDIQYIVFENGTVEYIQFDSTNIIGDIHITSYEDFRRNSIGCNYFDIFYNNINLYYERLFPKHDFGLKYNFSLAFDQVNYDWSFLSFDKDILHSYISFDFYPAGIKRISYYTGVNFMTGVGINNEIIEVGVYNLWGFSTYHTEIIERKIYYYGFHFTGGIQFFSGNKFTLKTGAAIGLVDKTQNGKFVISALGEISAGFRF
jgi:hypothetical protein